MGLGLALVLCCHDRRGPPPDSSQGTAQNMSEWSLTFSVSDSW